MNIGLVKWYDNAKGWGFLISGLEEVFLHRSQMCPTLAKYLKKDDRVLFDLYEDPKDPTRYVAKNVKLAP